MKLSDTIDLMNSADYKDRFCAEYYQIKERYNKLHRLVIKLEAKTAEFTPTCGIDLLKKQKAAMGEYLYCLEVRAEIEGVDLTKKQPCQERLHNIDAGTLASAT
jgi:hypothetical protein